MKKNNIKALIEACIKKEEGAWSKFIGRFSGLINWAAQDRLKRWGIRFNSEDIEDIRQQTFLNIWEKSRLIEVKNKQRIESWLVIVAGNFAFNYIRDRKRAEPPILESIFKQNLNIEDVSDTENIYSHLEGNEIMALVDNFINKLPPHHKAVLTLNYFYGKSHKEIAEILSISINTVSTIIKRAKDSLKEKIKARGFF